jgi:hypothetical protein
MKQRALHHARIVDWPAMLKEHIESQGFFEMLWDCEHCGTKGLLGKSQRHCAECGAPQNPEKRYFPTPEQQKQVVGHSFVGADRTCPSCKSPMGASAKNCTHCGSPMDGSKEVGSVEKAPAPQKKRRIWPYIVAGIAVLVLAIWFLFIRKSTAQLTVKQHRWERAIAIEEFKDHQQEAWRDQVPAGASLPICHRKQRSTRQVPDGEDCHTERHDKKDGTFEQTRVCKPKYRSEGVDDDWCTFTIRSWVQVDSAKTAGTGMTPAWATTVPPAEAPAALGARRSGAKTEKLYLDFDGKDPCEVSDAVWRKYPDGKKFKASVRARSGEVVCDDL